MKNPGIDVHEPNEPSFIVYVYYKVPAHCLEQAICASQNLMLAVRDQKLAVGEVMQKNGSDQNDLTVLEIYTPFASDDTNRAGQASALLGRIQVLSEHFFSQNLKQITRVEEIFFKVTCSATCDFLEKKSACALVQDYASLGKPFVYATPCTALQTPAQLLHMNYKLAQEIGLDASALNTPMGVDTLAGQKAWPNYDSIASIYCGHQFGSFVPQLGDGRALLIAEIQKNERYTQLQLKGAGPTPFSRQGDGRAVLRSSIREYLASEAMHCLGIPSTRALSLIGSQTPVYRETRETAAIVCRTAASFLRFGHIEYFCHTQQIDALQQLLKWHIAHNHPEIDLGQTNQDFSAAVFEFLNLVIERTAKLVANWQAVGFCHGVMNTDNMSLLGLTIDYGPFGFMDNFDKDHICNHSDQAGRYSYNNQPPVAHWNLCALAQALSPFLNHQKEKTQVLLDSFVERFEHFHQNNFARKLGLKKELPQTKQRDFIQKTLELLHTHSLDFTHFFRSLGKLNLQTGIEENWQKWQLGDFFLHLESHTQKKIDLKLWLALWFELSTPSDLDAINPAFVLRNHLLHGAIQKSEQGDHSELNLLFEALSKPFDILADRQDLYASPPPWAKNLVLSCSS